MARSFLFVHLCTLLLFFQSLSFGRYIPLLLWQDEVGVLTASFKKLITELKVYIRNLNDMAYVDALTGIGNRHALRRDYNSYQGHEVTVAMLDLDDFKLINDTHGHEEGDRVLREVGKLLLRYFRERILLSVWR